MWKKFAFMENATPLTCYIALSRDSGILTSLRPLTKLIDSNLDFGSFGVTGVKSSFLLKMLLLIQYTLYGHVTYAYKQAWDPLQNSLTQISIWVIWGYMGQKVISTKSDITRPCYIEWLQDSCTCISLRPSTCVVGQGSTRCHPES